jgi:DUF4097 and DUF4098 domain-containing protein YvlB
MSRASIVGMLIAAEIVIVGVAIYAVGLGRSGGFHGPAFAAGLHEARFTAKTVAPIEAGQSPQIAVDDRESRIVIATSDDGMVHVKDLTSTGGAFFADHTTIPQLDVKRTADGVSISRADYHGGFGLHFMFGSFDQRVEIDVPAGSHVTIARCSGADVSGITGGVAVRSQDGRIAFTDLRGAIDGRSDDGSISATRIRGDSLALQSADGRLSLNDVAVGTLDARTADGSIVAHDLAIAGGAQPHAALHSEDGSIKINGSFAPGGSYEISTRDGSIRLGLAPNSDLTVDASTGDGKILVDGSPFDNADGNSMHHTVKLGSGAGNLRLSSGDGSIHILTNGAV